MLKIHMTIFPMDLFTGKHEENRLMYLVMRHTTNFVDQIKQNFYFI